MKRTWPNSKQDWAILFVVYFFLVMMNTITVLTFRSTNHAVKQNSKQIQLLTSAVESRRVYNEISTVCILSVSGKVNTKEIPYTPEAINQAVKDCFDSEAIKRNAPVSSFDTTTTSTVSK